MRTSLPVLIIAVLAVVYANSLQSSDPTYHNLQVIQQDFTNSSVNLVKHTPEDTQISIVGVDIPYLGEIGYDILTIANMLGALIALIWSYFVAVISIYTLFPEWTYPFFMVVFIIAIFSMYYLIRSGQQ